MRSFKRDDIEALFAFYEVGGKNKARWSESWPGYCREDRAGGAEYR